MPAICAPPFNNICNKETITQKSFPNNPRISDVTPVFDVTPEDASLLKNYILFSILSVVSTIYERTTQKQILEYIDLHLSPHLCGYRKGFSTQTALMSIFEKC